MKGYETVGVFTEGNMEQPQFCRLSDSGVFAESHLDWPLDPTAFATHFVWQAGSHRRRRKKILNEAPSKVWK